jgi:hypothetical protein
MTVITLIQRLDYIESSGLQRGIKVRVLYTRASDHVDCPAREVVTVGRATDGSIALD